MKFLALADLHIRDYKLYNSSASKTHLPDRLLLYRTLAEDIYRTAKKEKCSFITIAGDIFDIHTNSPPVLNVLGDFLEQISQDMNVFVTHGQHDLATKTIDSTLKYLTALPVFQVVGGKVFYYHDEVVHVSNKGVPKVLLGEEKTESGDGISIYFYGWTPEIPQQLKKADVFVGHNMISGSTDYSGYEFSSGYNPKQLSEIYQFSVVGDIHNSQTFYDNVLIPGPPIQNKFKDSPVNGVWVIDSKGWKYKFVEFNSPLYPKFFLVSDKSDIPKNTPLNHYYKLLSRPTSDLLSDNIQVSSSNVDLWQLIQELIESKKVANQPMMLNLSRSHYDDVASISLEGRSLPSVKIHKLSIKNFLSIQEYDFDIPDGMSLLVGNIGSGKSSLLESIPFAFYGKISKGKYKDDVVPNCYEGEPEVIVTFSVFDTDYKIIRGVGKVTFLVNGKEVSGSKIQETQQLINNTIGLNYDEFSSLVFFAQDSGTFFGSMSESQQMSLMSMFLGSHTERVELLSSVIFDEFKKHKDEIVALEQRLKVLNENSTQYQGSIGLLELDSLDIKVKQTEILIQNGYTDVPPGVVNLLIQGKTVEATNLYFNNNIESLKTKKEIYLDKKSRLIELKSELESSENSKTSNLRLLKSKLELLTHRAVGYKSGVCSECGQDRPVDKEKLLITADEALGVKEEISVVESGLVVGFESKIDDIKSKIETLNSEIEKISNLITKMKSFSSCEKVTFGKLEELRLIRTMLDENQLKIDSTVKKLETTKLMFENYSFLHKQIFCDGGLKSKCIESVGIVISDYVNQLLQDVGLDISTTIKTVSYRKSGGFDPGFDVRAFFDGVETSYRMASGGQRMLIDLSSIVSIYNLLSSMYSLDDGVMGLICFDELVRYLDDQNIDAVSDILDHLNSRTKFLVSHDSKLKQLSANQVISAVRTNGISEYVL
jgi:DNA repair exonuclease SbcCD nuclease subunit